MTKFYLYALMNTPYKLLLFSRKVCINQFIKARLLFPSKLLQIVFLFWLLMNFNFASFSFKILLELRITLSLQQGYGLHLQSFSWLKVFTIQVKNKSFSVEKIQLIMKKAFWKSLYLLLEFAIFVNILIEA